MKFKKFNICTAKTYKKDGEERKAYRRIGQLTVFPARDDREEGFGLELYNQPNQKYYVFEDKPKEEKSDENTGF